MTTTTETAAPPASRASAAMAVNRAVAAFESGEATLPAALEANGWVYAPNIAEVVQKLPAAERRVRELSGAMNELAEFTDELRGTVHMVQPTTVVKRHDEILRESW